MAFSLTSVSPVEISADGGTEIEVTGVFENGHSYRIFIGDTATVYDPVCHSGVAGQGAIVYQANGTALAVPTLLRAYTPQMAPSVADYTVLVIDATTIESHALVSSITVMDKNYFTTVYGMRNVLPPHYKTGFKKIEFETPT